MKLELEQDHNSKCGIYAVSKPAKRADIKLAKQMAKAIDNSEEEWAQKYNMKAWAIAHAQMTLSPEPKAFFVVHPSLVDKKLNKVNAGFPSRYIFNPVILEAEKELVTYKNVRKTVMNAETGKREIKDNVPEKCTTPNIFEPLEGCMSFPHRKPKKIKRVFRMKVRYWYPINILGFNFLWSKTETVEGLKSQIFSHELQHFEGSNIFYSK